MTYFEIGALQASKVHSGQMIHVLVGFFFQFLWAIIYGHFQKVSVDSEFINDSHINKCPRTHMWSRLRPYSYRTSLIRNSSGSEKNKNTQGTCKSGLDLFSAVADTTKSST